MYSSSITCDENGNIDSVSLAYLNLPGTLSSSIGKLSELTALYLVGNHIIAPVPTQLALLTKLNNFQIHNNYIVDVPIILSPLAPLNVDCVLQFGS
jgi:Leucine-rich repeat (LRR) protein